MGVASALMAGGSVLSGIQADQTGIAQRKAYDANAQQAELQGNFDALTSMRQSRMEDGAMVAAGATGGGGMSGSLADIVYANAVQRQATAQNIRYGADQKAQGLRFQGAQARAAGRSALFGSLLKAAGSVAGSVTPGGDMGGAAAQPLGTIPVPLQTINPTYGGPTDSTFTVIGINGPMTLPRY